MKSDPQYLSEGIFSKIVFESHPYGLEANGTEESIPKITASSAKNHYHSVASAGNAFFVVAGDISEAEILKMLGEKLKSWKNVSVEENSTAQPARGNRTV